MIVLGIETSCDETAAAVVTDEGEVHADKLLSQLAEHAPYGGIVPEIAARTHLEHLDTLIGEAMTESGADFPDLGAVAATGGPGLIGGIIVGVMTAKAIATVAGVPFIAVNHLEGHALTARLTDGLDFPYLATAATAPPSTTPSARPSTRPRRCWASAIPAARRSSRRRSPEIRRGSSCRAR